MKPLPRSSGLRASILLFALGASVAAITLALAQDPAKTAAAQKAEEAKYRITPTPDETSPTGVKIPNDLDEALAELDRMLTPALKDEMRKGDEKAMGQYHFGLGMWMRNDWGFWKGLELAKWFNARGITHPDDMSGIVLTSYWRHLRGKPIALAGQVRFYKAYWKEALEEDAKAQRRAERAKLTIQRMILGLKLVPASPPSVTLPATGLDPIRPRYAAAFGNGVLLTAKTFTPASFHKEPNFEIHAFFVDPETRTMRPVEVREGGTVEDCVVVGARAYFNRIVGERGDIVEVEGDRRRTIPWPAFRTRPGFPVRLGIDRAADGRAVGLLALADGKLSRWTGDRWQTIPCGKVEFPVIVLPPEKLGDRLVFHDEGRDEMDKRLSWIDLTQPKGLVTFDRHVGVVGSYGPRWENVWDYRRTPNGDWWMSVGSDVGNSSLLRWNIREGYRVALYNDTLGWTGDFFTSNESTDDVPQTRFAVTGLEARPEGGVTAVGPHGLFAITGDSIRPLLDFKGGTNNWTPTTLLTLDRGRILLGGHWGRRRPPLAAPGRRLPRRLVSPVKG